MCQKTAFTLTTTSVLISEIESLMAVNEKLSRMILRQNKEEQYVANSARELEID